MDRQIDWPYKWWETAGIKVKLTFYTYSAEFYFEGNYQIFKSLKKINTRRETHKLLIIVDNISKDKARFKGQKETLLK